ncbi:hypothetical protein Pedsa_1877 [Pseudopedobacter saltans DSM 12145]|uniref:Uncharacterized protein n=1 Tax=Pseudopedobacter saltans (strain ATCC 51119 / DSM 12145 / JCM 21818 / CCUG 39354 / LMG 10337 / NBRC 100064 / NCIMB 13643) TaxID=762903 RepID=F0S8V0_PSESL|nr:hypothetical protein [Pseudopedobacter saltans]ADY52431.1 hypothetical protein Pedsa_1877 [Pseudopedobacter saltans DSM 12145]
MLYFFTAPLKWVVGREGKKRWQGVGGKNTASTPRKIAPLAYCIGLFFRGVAMALAILHNVIIGYYSAGIVAYKHGGNRL